MIAQRLSLSVIERRGFREVDNGALAGMKNEEADKLYPDLYWKGMD